jgi:hypothetical protein
MALKDGLRRRDSGELFKTLTAYMSYKNSKLTKLVQKPSFFKIPLKYNFLLLNLRVTIIGMIVASGVLFCFYNSLL